MTTALPHVSVTSICPRENRPFILSNTKQQYEGFLLDLLAELSVTAKFNYTLKVLTETRAKYSDLVFMLMNNQTDLVLADLSYSKTREEMIDFSAPFMNLGIGMLYKKEQDLKMNIFSFLEPFSIEIWIMIMLFYLIVSYVLYWISQHVDSDEDVNQWKLSVGTSLWETLKSLLGHSSDNVPRLVSTKLLTCFWWIFTLLMISCYTANLSAFLTVQRMEVVFNSPEDLYHQSSIKYGCVANGTTNDFMKERHRTIWENSERFNTNEEGIARVRKGKFVFFIESPRLEYEVARDCQLTRVGELLNNRYYAVGVQKSMETNTEAKLSENGKLEKMRQKWWQRGGETQCQYHLKYLKDQRNVSKLGLDNIGGAFILLSVGLVVVIVIASLERMWNTGMQQVVERKERVKLIVEEIFSTNLI